MTDLNLSVKYGPKGHILSINFEELDVAHGQLNEGQKMSDASVEDFLEHFGVKGMKWGKRTGGSDEGGSGGSSGGADRKGLRLKDKETYQKDRAQRSSDIQAARDRFSSGEARKDYKEAKAQYKADRVVVGKREARKAFDKVKAKNQSDYELSQELKDGKEVAKLIVGTVAGAVIASSLRGAFL